MCSYAVKNSFQYLAFSLLVIVVGAAAEELLPKFFGVGFPVLLAAAAFTALRRPAVVAALFAVAAGGTSDALSSLPPMTGAGFLLLLVLLVQALPFPWLLAFLVYPVYQVWLAVWSSAIGGEIYMRVLLSIPVGAVTALVVSAVLAWCERKAAVDDVE